MSTLSTWPSDRRAEPQCRACSWRTRVAGLKEALSQTTRSEQGGSWSRPMERKEKQLTPAGPSRRELLSPCPPPLDPLLLSSSRKKFVVHGEKNRPHPPTWPAAGNTSPDPPRARQPLPAICLPRAVKAAKAQAGFCGDARELRLRRQARGMWPEIHPAAAHRDVVAGGPPHRSTP